MPVVCFMNESQSSLQVLDLVTLIKPTFASFSWSSVGAADNQFATALSGT